MARAWLWAQRASGALGELGRRGKLKGAKYYQILTQSWGSWKGQQQDDECGVNITVLKARRINQGQFLGSLFNSFYVVRATEQIIIGHTRRGKI